MKTIFLILTLAAAASAQVICVMNTAPQGDTPVWSPVPPVERNYAIKTGGAWVVDIIMPAAGRCVGAFTSYDASDDLNATAANVLSRYVDKPKGDIELLFLDPYQFELWKADRSHSPIYSTHPQLSGRFAVDLPAGYYKLVISNRHSKLAPKSVDLMLGWPQKTTRSVKYRAP